MTLVLFLACQALEIKEKYPIDGVEITWMGVTTLVIRSQETTLLFDPFFSRPIYGQESSTESGIQLASTIFDYEAMDTIDAILVGHSHFDHAVDVGPIAKGWGADVIGSQSTCLIAEAQGFDPEHCSLLSDTPIEVGEFHITSARSPHWWSDISSIGAFSSYSGISDIDEISTAPNGGMYSIVIETPHGNIFLQDSMDPIESEDGSGIDFESSLTNLIHERPIDLWAMCGDCLEAESDLMEYAEIIQPTHVMPLHWDSDMPSIEKGLSAPFDTNMDLISTLPNSKLWIPTQYFDRYKLKEGSLSKVTSPLQDMFFLSSESEVD